MLRQQLYLLIMMSGLLFLVSCNNENNVNHSIKTSTKTVITPAIDTETAKQFIENAEQQISELIKILNHATWVEENFINYDTQQVSAYFNTKWTKLAVELAKEARKYDQLPNLDEITKRKLNALKLGINVPAPSDAEKIKLKSQLESSLIAQYGSAKYCRENGSCLQENDMTEIMATSKDPIELLEIWKGWREFAPAMKNEYIQLMQLANEGAQELGYEDLGFMWRSRYEMEPEEFAAELDRLWLQVKPLYDSLHCYVRSKLVEHYGENIVSPTAAIPAHLLGNMWAQDWANIYEIVAPENADPGYDLTQQIVNSGMSEIDMVKVAEQFFISLGIEPLPETFWERSLFTKPRDREVMCHASAWNLDAKNDIRIKMCTQKSAEDFTTIHHELGHNVYQRAYNHQQPLFQGGANGGFHEAIGDTIVLSITPNYLKQINLIDNIPDESKDLGILMKMALDRVSFLPFGLLIDRWRWKALSGEITPEQYNKTWWELREKYQGIAAPEPRGEEYFDPGAKYHIPANTSYTRYFIAHILQFQFHRRLCELANYEGSLHRCSIYGNEAAGKAFREMLAAGASKPWPDILEEFTGSRKIDATAVIDYFLPLKTWLDEQNETQQCGW